VGELSVRLARMSLRGGAVVLCAAMLAGCQGELGADTGQPASPDGGGGGSVAGLGVSPLDNSEGTRPGLAPVTSAADQREARQLIDKVRTKGRGPKTGYERDEFGYAWMDSVNGVPLAHNGCDTRNDLLARDGKDLKYRSGSTCVVVSMVLHDPYTGKTIDWRKAKATAVQIDHVVSVAATTKSSRSPL
jgi:hypothetical protein